MRQIALFLACSGLLVAACTPAPITRKKIGEACMTNDDCASTAFCQDALCTKDCAAQLDCPVGFDCGLAKPADTKPTCYKATWDMTMMGGFGTDCATYAKGCGAAMNPCAAGFDCRATLKCDPDAYCTKSCTADTDCPPTMFCSVEKDMSRLCTKRSFCHDCAVDDQCPFGQLCITDKGGGHYCAQKCSATTDCHQPLNGSANFETCVADMGGKALICLPSNGYCKGPSPIAGQGMNGICSPCRPGVPSDCADGGVCLTIQFTTERFCSKACTFTSTTDSCPASDQPTGGTYCLGQMGKGFCCGDSSFSGYTCYP